MLAWIRDKFGKAMIVGIIGLIAFVFIFYGVFSPKSTRGLHEGAVAGTVNGHSISISEFNSAYQRKIELFKNMMGGKVSEDQLRAFQLKKAVFNELANRKLVLEEANRQGLVASDEQIRHGIREIPAFQKDGQFDYLTYKRVLEANRLTPGAFEKMVRDDSTVQQLGEFFRNRARVSNEEVRREFLRLKDQRNIKYVVIGGDLNKKAQVISEDDVKKFLDDAAQMAQVKAKFEQGKESTYKGQKLESVQSSIARSLISAQRLDEVQKKNTELADQVVAALKADSKSDAKLKALLKSASAQLETTGLISRTDSAIPGIGDVPQLVVDAFAVKSPIDLNSGGQPKKYFSAGRWVVAGVVAQSKPDLSQLEAQRSELLEQLSSRKLRKLAEEWEKKVTAGAKIDTNPAVVGETETQ